MINTPELIKLAKQAGYVTQITLFMDGQREDIWGGSNETQKLEKFAELIVKECILICKSHKIQSTEDVWYLAHNETVNNISENIEEYFGVEE
jgi:hypothetical protein